MARTRIGVLREIARAKINLYLHVIGRRDDGYHDLDSLVVFADIGDEIEVAPADHISLAVAGPFADQVPDSAENLVLRAARALGSAMRASAGSKITLTKNLPVAAGLGGGSADAAATLRALCQLWEVDTNEVDLESIAAGLGADVPVCLAGRASTIRGKGDVILPAPPLPVFHLVLVNPAVALSTPEVFARFGGGGSGEAPLQGRFRDVRALTDALSARRNDLEDAAQALVPAIGDALRLVGDTPGCLLARMSGSGATCFGMFENAVDAGAAAELMRRSKPNWWIQAAAVQDD